VRGLAETNHNMGIAFRHKGEYVLADNAERRAIEFAREARDDRLIALALLGRAEILFAQGDAQLAEAAARRAANDFGALPDPIQQAGALRLAGAACLALGKGNAAREVLQTALALARLHGSALDEAEILAVCAKERVAANDRMRARLDGMTALEIFDRLGARDGCAATLAWLGEHAPAGDPS
jgi:tetratricopeptide (TPR) repeat protein